MVASDLAELVRRLTPEQAAVVDVELRAISDEMAAHPLAYASLWDREAPRTSQRRAVRDLLGSGSTVMLLLGGNRSGKSESAAQVAVAFALGRSHPDVSRWCERNGIPPSLVPDGPGEVWAVALDNGDSLEYMRPKIERYLPPGSKWRNRFGQGPASVELPGGGRIGCKSVDEGRDGFQGTAKRLIWCDEEPGDKEVVGECMMRLVDERGRLFVSMTPLNGMSWVYDKWVADSTADACLRSIHGLDNPHVPADFLERMLSSFGPHERAARERGEFVVLEGRVYTDWNREIHVVPGFTPPASWTRYVSIDPGTRAPCAMLLGALDPADDTLHLIAEVYHRERSYSQHAETIKGLTGGASIDIVCDPEDRGFRMALAAEHEIQTIAARKAVRAGISAVADRLRPDANGKPHLLIHDTLRQTIREIEGYVWAPTVGKSDAKDAPLKKDDHLMDAARYLCMHLSHSAGMGAS